MRCMPEDAPKTARKHRAERAPHGAVASPEEGMSNHPQHAAGRSSAVTPDSSPATAPGSERRGQRSTGSIVRRRLLEMLGSLRPLTVVSASAGYGKSTLVESWAAEPVGDVTVVRLSLENDDLSHEAWWLTLEEALTVAGVALRCA